MNDSNTWIFQKISFLPVYLFEIKINLPAVVDHDFKEIVR